MRLLVRAMLRSSAAPLLALSLAGCTASALMGPATESQAAGPATPASEKVGEGSRVIGILASDEPGNLSGGAANSVYQAAKLAATTLAEADVTLLIRRYEAKPSALKQLAAELAAAGATLVVGPEDDKGAASLRQAFGAQKITVISLGRQGAADQALFAAGPSWQDEAAAVAQEMSSRRYGSVVVAVTPSRVSQAYGATLVAALGQAGLAAKLLDISEPQKAVPMLEALMADAEAPRAIAFATDPQRALALAELTRGNGRLAGLDMVGNGGWSVAPPSAAALGKGWYPSPGGNALAAFGRRFATAYGQAPTLAGAIAYDLVVLGSALPQLVPEDPYGPAVLTNGQGFKGQSGSFVFAADGAATRSYSIVTLK